MRPRTLLVLFLVVAGLGTFIWWFERELPSADERRDRSRKLLVMEPESVDELTLSSAGQVVRLAREDLSADEGGDGWKLVEPALGPADADQVESFLEAVAALAKERTLEDGSRESLGLTTPRVEIGIGGLPQGGVSLRFGSQVPASDNAIVELGTGPPFYVVRDSLFEDASRSPDDWRSRDAIPVERSSIHRIDVLEPPTGVALERDGDGFRLVAPLEDEADNDKVSSLLAGLTDLEIEEFLDDPDEGFGLEAPAVSLRLSVEGRDTPMLVSIATAGAEADEENDDGVIVMRVDDRTFRADTNLGAEVSRPAAEWQSPRWSARRSFEIDRVSVRRGGEDLVLERKDGAWLRDGEEVGYSVVDKFLRALTDAAGTPTEAGPTSEAGSKAPVLELTLDAGGSQESLHLLAVDFGYLAARSGRTVVLAMNTATVDDLLASLEELEAAPAVASAESPEESLD